MVANHDKTRLNRSSIYYKRPGILSWYSKNEANKMQAVVFKGPLQVALEQRPRPQIKESTDAILKVRYTALCGSELHVFRGHQPSGTGFIMGHEFTGEVVEVGADVRSFKQGDRVVSPFTVSCGECFYCSSGFSSRCARGQLYGSAGLDGGQAEYVRVPLAESTLFHAPAAIDEKKLVLMADIFPTGYFAASNAFRGLEPRTVQNSTVLLFGCGPVGICALVSALEHRPKHLIAIDSVPSRLQLAQSFGAESWNFQENETGLRERVKELTDGRGADVVIEVVGHSSALRMGFEMLRPWGVLSSVGVHNGEIPWTGNEAYGKNLRLQMGRCPVRSIFGEAMELLAKKQDVLNFMSEDIRPLSQAVQAYEDFNQMKSQKVIFEADK
ncbi:Putative Threonine dehydrogenase [Penicillium brasilianum]|uniref:Putative Threonine dehydrogenase n=1 Tax=Penicillium brasilianum TaxID=104259 RepID=A0A0F7U1Y9_PENBI|nr:Putative Threonine dehydrogenase [Penicillium brasilianum]